jgi:tetratricopeptide (TPR) repeat protein
MQHTEPDMESTDSGEFEDIDIRRGGRGKWLVLLLVLIGGGALGTFYLRPDVFAGLWGKKIDKQALDQTRAGYRELMRDSYAAMDRAVEYFEKATSISAEHADAHAGLAEAQIARAEYLAEEIESLSTQLDKLPPAEREKTHLQIENKRREIDERSQRAFESAKKAYSLDRESLAANRAMAAYYQFKRAPDKMRPLVDKARTLAVEDPGVNCLLGASVARVKGSLERAIRYFDKALESEPGMQRARYMLARAHAQQGNPEKAKVQLETLLGQVPDHERAQALLAALKEPAAPEPEPEPESESEGPSYESLMAQAERLRESDRAGKALKFFEQAREIAPEDPDVHTGIGWCYVDLENPSAAIATFNTALRYAPRLSDAHMGLAEAYNMKGDTANAITHYEEYLDIMPNGPEAPVARRMIKLLKK